MSGRRIATGIGSLFLLLAPILVFLGRGGLITVDMMAPGEAPRAIAGLIAKIGHPPGAPLGAVDITIDHGSLTAELRNATSPDVTDKWSVMHIRALRGLVDREYISGPQPVGTSTFSAPVRDRLFELSDIDFAAVPAIASAAAARVALRESMTVSELSLSRVVYSGLRSGVGAPRWVISVHSVHESATAFADAKGHITGANLTGTLRAQLFDLYQGGQPLLDTVRALSDEAGSNRPVTKALIYRQSMRIEANNPAAPGGTEGYNANIDGAYRERNMPLMPPPSLWGKPPTFAFADVDWAALPRLIQTARDGLEMPNAEISIVEINRDTRAVGAPPVQWIIDLRDRDGDTGRIALGTDGAPRQIDWPKRRARENPVNMLLPEQMAAFIDALRTSLGPGGQVLELVFRTDEAIAVVRDPKQPRNLADLHFTGLTINRGFMPEMPPGTYMGSPFEDASLFDPRVLDPGWLAAIQSVRAAALDRLAIKGGEVTAIGIGRHQDLMPRVRDLNIEVDVTGDDRRSGRYFADSKGHVLRVETP